jgi:SET domain-containing protein
VSKRGAPAPPGAERDGENEWFELRRSGIHGRGAFARKTIPRGTRVIEYTGEKISNAEADRRYDESKMRRHHTFLFILSSRTVVDAAVRGNAARFINHSCAPNCEAVIERGHIWIETVKRIPVGTELVYDYQYEYDDEYTAEDLARYKCVCGAPKCRGTIVTPKPRK